MDLNMLSSMLEEVEFRWSDEPEKAPVGEGVARAIRGCIDAAWPRLSALVRHGEVDRHVLLAAADAVAAVRPDEAGAVPGHLLDSGDDQISEAVLDALTMAESEMESHENLHDLDDDTPLHLGPYGNGGVGGRRPPV